jgi:hypothetical protein
MSVNNSNQEFKTREEYKRTKAEELQRKKDLVKRAKDEARQLKDAEKRAKDEARDAEKRAKDEAQRTKDAENRAKDVSRKTQDAENRTKDVSRKTQDAENRTKDVSHKTQAVDKQAKKEALNQKRENPETPKVKETKTREAQRSANPDDKVVDAAPVSYKRIRVRLIPIWLRLILLVVLVFISVVAGAIVGYGMLGGGKIAEVFQESTWTHIIDLVEKGK